MLGQGAGRKRGSRGSKRNILCASSDSGNYPRDHRCSDYNEEHFQMHYSYCCCALGSIIYVFFRGNGVFLVSFRTKNTFFCSILVRVNFTPAPAPPPPAPFFFGKGAVDIGDGLVNGLLSCRH